MGRRGIEPRTSSLSAMRSNRLSYRPVQSQPNRVNASEPTVIPLLGHQGAGTERGAVPWKLNSISAEWRQLNRRSFRFAE